MKGDKGEKVMTITEIKKKISGTPLIGCVLGSGLGGFADSINAEITIDYSDIDGLIASGVDGHKGRLIIGKVSDTYVAVMQGRVHYYEGHSMSDVVKPIRFLKDLGVETVILTNAAGGINKTFKPSDIMIITDHILLAPNPLIGKNDDNYGTRFPDMSQVYDLKLRQLTDLCAKELRLRIRHGVYAQLTGPSYETPSEIRALKAIGADAVGMSTAAEAVTARHANMRVLGISLITNSAASESTALTHDEVKNVAGAIADDFSALLNNIIVAINKI